MQYSLIVPLLFCLFMGCTSTPKTCINERTNNTVIRWGDYTMSNGAFKGFEYHAETLSLYAVSKESQSKAQQITSIDTLNATLYCTRLNKVIEGFTEIQSLYSPGEIARSVEYINVKTNVHKKALWNPAFSTFGSKEFRAIFDSLMTSVPSKYQWITKNDSVKK